VFSREEALWQAWQILSVVRAASGKDAENPVRDVCEMWSARERLTVD
jgi:hypothetical protein